MRPELELIATIEKYLLGEMSPDEKEAFESRLNKNPKLQKDVKVQKDLLEGLERMSLREGIRKAKRNYIFRKSFWKFGLGALVVASAVVVFTYADGIDLLLDNANQRTEESFQAYANELIPSQAFQITTENDTVIETQGGLVIAIPQSAFLDSDGTPVSGVIDLEIKEALDAQSIMEAGLSTESNGHQLETGGMFFVDASQQGLSLTINPSAQLIVEVQAAETKKGMQLFDGEYTETGQINWVNPKPIEDYLSTVDIRSLDFYPPGYIDTLSRHTRRAADKEFADSLFYSYYCGEPLLHDSDFTQMGHLEIHETYLSENEVLWISIVENLTRDTYRVSYQAVIPPNYRMYTIDEIPMPLSFDFENNPLVERLGDMNFPVETNAYDVHFDKWTSYYWGRQRFSQDVKLLGPSSTPLTCTINYMIGSSTRMLPGQSSTQTVMLSPTLTQASATDSIFSPQCDGINPSKIEAIWCGKYQNTILATKEFESRLAVLYKSCDEELLDLFVTNLTRPMYEIDSLVMLKSSGYTRQQFEHFFELRHGRVRITDRLSEKLADYYSTKSAIYAHAARKTNEEFWKKQRELDSEADNKRIEQQKIDRERRSENYKLELELNLTEAYRQLGKEKPQIATPIASRYSFPLSSTGWKNVDRYVRSSTKNRTTLDYTAPDGKKAVIKYEPLILEMATKAEYDRVYAYLISEQQFSFLKMEVKKNGFQKSLNELMQYHALCIGYKGDQAYLFTSENVSPGKTNIVLAPVSESRLQKEIKRLTNSQSTDDIRAHLEYEHFVIKDKARKVKNAGKIELKAWLRPVVFPCLGRDDVREKM